MIRTALRVPTIIIVTLISQSLGVSAWAQIREHAEPTKVASQIYSTLLSRFQKEHPGDIRIELDDIRACQADPIVSFTKANRFLVLARALFYDTRSHSQSDLLGVFIFDDSLTTILRTIDIIGDAHEYAYKIAKVWKDTLTIHGEGFGHDWPPIDKKYKLYFWNNYK